MKALGRYSIIASLLVLAFAGVLWFFLDSAGRTSLLIAAAIALPIQIGSFALLMGPGKREGQLMIWWAAGMAGRILVVAAIGLSLDSLTGLDPAVLLLSLCGIFFALILLESAFLTRFQQQTEVVA